MEATRDEIEMTADTRLASVKVESRHNPQTNPAAGLGAKYSGDRERSELLIDMRIESSPTP
jgi:hypothetical protein